MLQAGPGICDGRRQHEIPELPADDLRVKERFGFDGHGRGRSLAKRKTDGKNGVVRFVSVSAGMDFST